MIGRTRVENHLQRRQKRGREREKKKRRRIHRRLLMRSPADNRPIRDKLVNESRRVTLDLPQFRGNCFTRRDISSVSRRSISIDRDNYRRSLWRVARNTLRPPCTYRRNYRGS